MPKEDHRYSGADTFVLYSNHYERSIDYWWVQER